jgi:sulfite reductase (NADPH) flavoprotein alpha-component
MLPRTRARLARAHRLLALLLAPIFLAILVSGAALAFRPILGEDRSPATVPAPVDVAGLISLLHRVDPTGTSPYLFVTGEGRTVGVIDPGTGEPAYYDLATGAAAKAPAPRTPDFYEVALRIHKDLWFGMGGLVGFATFAMLVLVFLGPVLSRPPRDPATPLGWHIQAGWLLWPLLALLPVSVVLMKLHAPVVTQRTGAPMPLAQAIEIGARTEHLARLRAAQALPGGSAMLFTESVEGGPSRYVLHADGVHAFESPVSRVGRALHEGTWAGRWSGIVNLVAALLLILMLVLGLVSWSRSRRSARDIPAGAAGASRVRQPAPASR